MRMKPKGYDTPVFSNVCVSAKIIHFHSNRSSRSIEGRYFYPLCSQPIENVQAKAEKIFLAILPIPCVINSEALGLFLIFDNFESGCSYEIILIKKSVVRKLPLAFYLKGNTNSNQRSSNWNKRSRIIQAALEPLL